MVVTRKNWTLFSLLLLCAHGGWEITLSLLSFSQMIHKELDREVPQKHICSMHNKWKTKGPGKIMTMPWAPKLRKRREMLKLKLYVVAGRTEVIKNSEWDAELLRCLVALLSFECISILGMDIFTLKAAIIPTTHNHLEIKLDVVWYFALGKSGYHFCACSKQITCSNWVVGECIIVDLFTKAGVKLRELESISFMLLYQNAAAINV